MLKLKRPIGHITHLKNQFQSINTFWQSYDYTIMLIEREFLRIEWSLFDKTLTPLHPTMLCQVWNWPTGSGEFFKKFCQCIFVVSWLTPHGNGLGPSFKQTWIPFTQGCFVPSLVEIGLHNPIACTNPGVTLYILKVARYNEG